MIGLNYIFLPICQKSQLLKCQFMNFKTILEIEMILQDLYPAKSHKNTSRHTSIKDILHENELEKSKIKLPFTFKAMILGAVLQKTKIFVNFPQECLKRRALARWRVNADQKWAKYAINRLVTAGPIRKESFFYKLKCVANASESNTEGFKRTHRRTVNKDPSLGSSLQETESSILKQIRQSKINKKPSLHRDISAIFGQNEEENHIQLGTYINLFQQSFSEDNLGKKQGFFNKLQKIFGLREFQRKAFAFRVIFQQSLEQDFEEELLKAKRNLQLAENSLILENRMQKLDETHLEQFQNLQKISNELSFLRQKFLLSKTKDLIRVLKKLFYPVLTDSFETLSDQMKTMKFLKTIPQKYEVLEIFSSEKSLSQEPSRREIDCMWAFRTKKSIGVPENYSNSSIPYQTESERQQNGK